ncbi:purine biosynthesis protein PurH [uncultured Clostridium sp.]|uniref:purine biosynthesis protein PurH n=1 Tax=uncultured Clostridium sp. TaxID=59620 RepID=UPI0025FEB511|nr:purine biosynthesis protein PurH [uncultured Clostridium sp.]
MDKFLIKNTTRAQREQIVKDSLGYSDLGCDDCVNGYDLYQPYIDGEKEISEITQSYRTSYISEHKDDFRRHGCSIR